VKEEVLTKIAQSLDSYDAYGESLYDFLDWLYSEGSGYEEFLQPLIVRCLRGEGINVSLKGKIAQGDCDFFIDGEGIELKTPRVGWGNQYKYAFVGHPKADSYLFIHKGKKHYEEACIKAEEHYTTPLASNDWWLTWMRLKR